MSVSLNPPSALGFNRPLTQTVKRSLTVINHNAQPVAFKVKTTAPKLYCVRPNSGRIEPGESVEVSVMLQAMREEPPLSAKCKDKFLIQSTIISPEKETMNLNDIWNATGDSEETKIHQHKVRVVYLAPEGLAVQEEDEGHVGAASALDNSGFQHYGTVQQHPSSNGHPIPEFSEAHTDRPASPPPPPPIEIHEAPDLHEEHLPAPAPEHYHPPPPPREPSPVPEPESPAPPPPTEPQPDPNVELFEKYNEAQVEIQRLRALLAAMPGPSTAPTMTMTNGATSTTGDLRRRTRALSDATSTMTGSLAPETDFDSMTMVDERMGPQEGVPLPVVIVIALGVFITTYLFF
ncbi:hypothetical protein JAAARDRAFT_121704 [Jaapia argillacea MUCL 33604]|uniref:MSP domain-containing protein n=1 Tax=Jaapia argillacea MUCL 33604 TaxID=933084 RepID=A0A067Q5N4_9AGAM|nr:hypothetical protein JAAARDRAFT_121704 [Jaapia argillacea MUCL 33604]